MSVMDKRHLLHFDIDLAFTAELYFPPKDVYVKWMQRFDGPCGHPTKLVDELHHNLYRSKVVAHTYYKSLISLFAKHKIVLNEADTCLFVPKHENRCTYIVVTIYDFWYRLVALMT